MSWSYWSWVGCSVGISVGIFFLTLTVLIILLFQNDTIFYGIVAQLLNMERCFIDVHHNILRKDEKLNLSTDMVLQNIRPEFLPVMKTFKDLGNKGQIPAALQRQLAEQYETKKSEEGQRSTSQMANGSAGNNNGSANTNRGETKQEISSDSKSRSDLERPVLNMYGRYMSVHKRGTLAFLVILTTLIISASLVAAFNSLFLNTSSVYQDGPCPPLGPMECFCGSNSTFFLCDTGKTVSCPYNVHSAACFRWIARDVTTSDVTTQLGVTAGLLVAFGNIAQAIIRIYLLAFNKRLNIATGIHRIAAKTIGINGYTAGTNCCCCRLPWHCSACNLRLFKNPAAVIILTAIYIVIPFLMIPGVILLYRYELSVTALTFVVLVVFAVLCILAIVWIMVQESEASSNIPGGWTEAKQLIQGAAMHGKDVAMGPGSRRKT